MKPIKPNLFILLSISIIIIVSCDDDNQIIYPEYGTISGVVDFSGSWPEIGNISISLNASWPEVTGAPYAFKTINFTELNQNNLYIYSFENVAFATYQGIIVSWKDPYDDNAATNQHVIGGYGATVEAEFKDADSITVSVSDAVPLFDPTAVLEIPDVKYEKTNLNFTADLDLIVEIIPAESGTISGKVTFSGTWPTGTVFMSLNSLWPLQTTPNYYSTIASDNLIDNKYNYSFENVTFGIYTIAVVWLNPNGRWETLGAYGSDTPPDFEDAESVTITVIDFELTGFNFSAKFGD